MFEILTQKTSGVYQIVNTRNGHKYIGSAVDIRRRWIRHRSDLRGGVHHSQYLQRAWIRYGEDCFHFCVLEKCAVSVMVEREQFYIDNDFPEYNIAPKAGTTTPNNYWLGKSRSLEDRKKISNSLMGHVPWNKGKQASEETRKKMSNAQKGHPGWGKGKKQQPLTDAIKQKISESLKGHAPWRKGKKDSEETRRKKSEAAKNRWARKISAEENS